ncbi:uncharacterized protein TNCV_3389201 [Trichonephila clavipes]|nr:uncharacterized protein TNCV_3389201 [Trichonephila clavipes]
MAPHAITPAVEVVCHCKAKAGLRRSPRGLHTRTRLSSLLRLSLDSSQKTTWFSIPLQSSFLVRCTTPNGGVDGWASRAAHVMGAVIPNVLQPSAFVWFEKTQGAPSEGATCAWIAADEEVGCSRAFLMKWRSSQRLVCQGYPEPGLCVNNISRILWSQHLLTTQSQRPNWQATRLADHLASIMPMILPLSNCESCSYCLRKRRNGMSTSTLAFGVNTGHMAREASLHPISGQ